MKFLAILLNLLLLSATIFLFVVDGMPIGKQWVIAILMILAPAMSILALLLRRSYEREVDAPPEIGATFDSEYEGLRHYEEGIAHHLAGRCALALEEYDEAIALGHNEGVFENRGFLLQHQEYHYDAIDDFDRAIKLSPNDCNLFFGRSNSRSAVGDYEGAVADLRAAIELSRTNSELNAEYDAEAKRHGSDNVTLLYELRLHMLTQLGPTHWPLKREVKRRNLSS